MSKSRFMLFNFKYFYKVIYASIVLFAIVVTGTLGFMLVEGWSLLDSFFMTIITVSTVGFNEVNELSQAGQLFTAFLIIFSFGTFAYALTAITTYIASVEYKAYFKTLKEVESMENHVIVCGYGRVGKQAVSQLNAHNKKYVILENSEKVIEKHSEDVLFLNGNATVDEDLIKAEIKSAKALITTLPSDADNLFVVLSARELNPILTIISRASNVGSVKKLKIAGANNVIMPDSIGGSHMAFLVVTPDVVEFLDHISIQGSAEINLEEITFEDLPETFKRKSIGELNAQKLTGCNIIGYRSPGGEYMINPSSDIEIIPGSKLFVLGNPDQIKLLNSILGLNV